MNEINIALLGSKFMGRAHSNAWLNVGKFFDVDPLPVMHTVVGRNAAPSSKPSPRNGVGRPRSSTDWQAQPSTAPTRSASSTSARRTTSTPSRRSPPSRPASTSPVRSRSPAHSPTPRRWSQAAEAAHPGQTFVWYNYRRVPAVALAHQLVQSGAIGRIYHVRACYLQSWGGPDTPLLWRFQGDVAGSGAHGDLNAHIIDAVRFVTGEEITVVEGAIEQTFIDRAGAAGRTTPEARSREPAQRPPAPRRRAPWTTP